MHTSLHHLPALVKQQLEQALELIKALAALDKVLLLPQPAYTGIDTKAASVPYPDPLNLLVLLEEAGNAQRTELQEKLKLPTAEPAMAYTTASAARNATSCRPGYKSCCSWSAASAAVGSLPCNPLLLSPLQLPFCHETAL